MRKRCLHASAFIFDRILMETWMETWSITFSDARKIVFMVQKSWNIKETKLTLCFTFILETEIYRNRLVQKRGQPDHIREKQRQKLSMTNIDLHITSITEMLSKMQQPKFTTAIISVKAQFQPLKSRSFIPWFISRRPRLRFYTEVT